MKNKTWWLVLLLSVSCFFSMASLSSAVPIPSGDCLRVEKDVHRPWVIHLIGNPADLALWNYLVQYAPDDLKEINLNKIAIPAKIVSDSERIFEMDKVGLELGMIGFNFANTDKWTPQNKWLGIPSSYVSMGPGIRMTMSDKDPNIYLSGGAHFVNLYGPWSNFAPLAGFIKSGGAVCKGDAADSIVRTTPDPAPVAAPAPAPAPSKKKVAKTKIKKSSQEECVGCEGKIKKDTKDILDSVGKVDLNENPAEREVQQKLRIILPETRKISKAIGEGKKNEKGEQVPLHQKVGEPPMPGTTLFSTVEFGRVAASEAAISSVKVLEIVDKPWWKRLEILLLALVIGILFYLVFRRRR